MQFILKLMGFLHFVWCFTCLWFIISRFRNQKLYLFRNILGIKVNISTTTRVDKNANYCSDMGLKQFKAWDTKPNLATYLSTSSFPNSRLRVRLFCCLVPPGSYPQLRIGRWHEYAFSKIRSLLPPAGQTSQRIQYSRWLNNNNKLARILPIYVIFGWLT